MNRALRRERDRIKRALDRDIARHGIGSLLTRIFGDGQWTYDAREQLWIVPDHKRSGAGREYYCVRADGTWFKAVLEEGHTQ